MCGQSCTYQIAAAETISSTMMCTYTKKDPVSFSAQQLQHPISFEFSSAFEVLPEDCDSDGGEDSVQLGSFVEGNFQLQTISKLPKGAPDPVLPILREDEVLSVTRSLETTPSGMLNFSEHIQVPGSHLSQKHINTAEQTIYSTTVDKTICSNQAHQNSETYNDMSWNAVIDLPLPWLSCDELMPSISSGTNFEYKKKVIPMEREVQNTLPTAGAGITGSEHRLKALPLTRNTKKKQAVEPAIYITPSLSSLTCSLGNTSKILTSTTKSQQRRRFATKSQKRRNRAHPNAIFAKQCPTTPKMNTATKSPARNRKICPFCKKCLETKYKLDRHILTHTGERPFECQDCKAKFNQKSSLKTHSSIHAKSILKDSTVSRQKLDEYTINGYTLNDLGLPIAAAAPGKTYFR